MCVHRLMCATKGEYFFAWFDSAGNVSIRGAKVTITIFTARFLFMREKV